MDAAALEALGTPALMLATSGVGATDQVVGVNRRWHAASDRGHRCFPDAEAGRRLPDALVAVVRVLDTGADDDLQCDELACGRWWRLRLRPAREGDLTLLTASDVTAARRAAERETTARTLDAVGRLGGGLAHDLNNVLTGVLGYADLLELRRGRQEVGSEVSGIRASVDRARALLEQVLTFSRRRPVQPAVLDVNGTLTALRPTIADVVGGAIGVELDLTDEGCLIRMDRVSFEHVVLNVVVNARDAMPQGGTLRVTSTVRDATAIVMIRDSGAGMAAETAARSMEPFFTTDPAAHAGLGLSVAYGIARQHGGDLRVVTRPGVGTAIFLEVPTADAAEAEGPASPVLGAATGKTILLAEDEVTIRDVIASLLADQGYEVVCAGDGAEALAFARQLDRPPDLLVTDVAMPTMDGTELVRHLRREHPALRVVLMTGYTERELDEAALGVPVPQVLHKPFGLAALLDAVRSAVADI